MVLFTWVCWLLTLLVVLLAVAFFTLFERKVMGLAHLRVGPNKISLLGLFQPLLDALKLLSKTHLLPSFANPVSYYSAPFFSLGISLALWLVLPAIYLSITMRRSLLVFILLTSLLVFPLLVRGWSANSKYSLVGSLRAIAQSISYEAVLSTLIVGLLLVFITYRVFRVSVFKGVFLLIVLPLWVFSALAECHRAPFDFSESESELVSGFNTEYIGRFFAFVFLAEYSALLVSCALIAWIFFHNILTASVFIHCLLVILVRLAIIVVRVTFCRFRYDLLIIFAWKSFLPSSLILVILIIFLI